MENRKRIFIATGIFPPDIGGPAQYAYELEKVWRESGHKVAVKYFGKVEKFLPTGLRHIYFLIKTKWAFLCADKIFVLDTWSAALPIAILSFITRKKFIIRTGGDFLWESYVERTKKKVLFSNFYKDGINNLNDKEKFIFSVTKWILRRADKIVFSTEWQRNIWLISYNIPKEKTLIIENYYGKSSGDSGFFNKTFLASSRDLVWKNLAVLKDVFEDNEVKQTGFVLDIKTSRHDEFMSRMQGVYAVILVSLGDISPNTILDAIRCGKPFIVTKETGIYDRVKDIGIFVDPLSKNDVKEKVLWLCDPKNYETQKEKIRGFSFTHSWDEIGNEFLNIA